MAQMRCRPRQQGRPGTGPFFGEKTLFCEWTMAENMDLSPSRQRFGRFTMYWHPWTKLMALSGAVAGGGILACAAALLDLLVPTASTPAFIAMTVVLGLAIAAVVATFAWLCGYWDEAGPDRTERLVEAAERRSEDLARKAALRKSLDQERRQKAREFPPQTYLGESYRTTLRGFGQPKSPAAGTAAASPWRHGQ
jgi:hypothetical protein